MIQLGPLDLVGLTGVCAYVVAHFLVQVRHESPLSQRVVVLNVAGPICVLVSLIDAFNIASFLSQSMWLVLTLVGWGRYRLHQRRGVADGHLDVAPMKRAKTPGLTVEPGTQPVSTEHFHD